MAKRRKKAKRRTRRPSRRPASSPGWIWGLFGLGIGLSVSAFIYLNGRGSPAPAPAAVTAPAPAPMPASPAGPAPEPAAEEPADDEPRFTFYDMLPTFEVVIPEEREVPVAPAEPAKIVEEPGIYILQAGSFSRHADADRRKAELALLGIESGIQKVAVDDKVYHRVRIGPIESLGRLNDLRQRLHGAKIEAMVIRVGE